MSDPILSMAALRRTHIPIGGQTVIVQEPRAVDMMDYRDGLRDKTKGRTVSLTELIHLCVINEDGSPRFTLEEAAVVATGSRRVLLPLIDAITQFTEGESDIKKVEAPTDDSSSDSRVT